MDLKFSGKSSRQKGSAVQYGSSPDPNWVPTIRLLPRRARHLPLSPGSRKPFLHTDPILPSPPTGLLHAGRAEQISAKVRMAYRPVADDIDERGLAGPQCTFEGRAKILRPLDVLTVTIHELEHPVVALVR